MEKPEEETTTTPGSSLSDLVKELNKQTETAAPAQPPSPPISHDNGGTGSEFDDEPEHEKETPTTTDPEPVFSTDRAMKTARRWIKTFSSALKFILKPIYRSTVLAKGDIEKMQDFRNKHRGMSEQQMEEALHSQHELYPVANRFDKYLKAVEELPLDQEEIESIAEPLSELIIKYKKLQLGPEWSLVFAVAMVVLPRLTPMMPDLSKIFASAQDKAGK